ncbi:hypothetical protein [Streptomyces lavendulocolor]|uniref:hypothetical protein n=1 Tax=Streptomyces lavendulocolor TaxID=67316 RepID=UPI0033FD8BB3
MTSQHHHSPGATRPDKPPSPGARLLGPAIARAAARAAAPGGLRFTERQLYYATCRVLSPGSALLRRVPRTPAPPLRLTAFTRALDARGRHTVEGLLPPVPPGTGGVYPVHDGDGKGDRDGDGHGTSEPDVYAYGLPRLLVCQDPSIARMLLANHVHLEAACPVLTAVDALPLGPRLTAALERAGGATVHVLHDASPSGLALPARIRAALGPVPGVRVSSMGLVPRHVAALRLPSGRGPVPGPVLGTGLPPGLRPAEARWLARGRFAEVAAVPPARLVRTVLRVTRGSRPPRASLRSDLRGLRDTGFLTWPSA